MSRLRRVRVWWAREHARFRVPWCWQCRLGWRHGDGLYEHDEPAWRVRELAAQHRAPRAATYWWSAEHGLRRWGTVTRHPTRHQTLSGRLRREWSRWGFRGLWFVAWVTFGSWDGFTHVVVHNGPLWRLCADCRELRREDAS